MAAQLERISHLSIIPSVTMCACDSPSPDSPLMPRLRRSRWPPIRSQSGQQMYSSDLKRCRTVLTERRRYITK